MIINVYTVEGSTQRKGLKQNKTYSNCIPSPTPGFFRAIDEKGREYSLWNVNGDWTLLGISTIRNMRRTSYTKNFEVIDPIAH